MPKGIPCLTEIQKQEIIKRVTDKGERAVDLAKEFKVNQKIIYNLLKTKANQHQASDSHLCAKSRCGGVGGAFCAGWFGFCHHRDRQRVCAGAHFAGRRAGSVFALLRHV